MITIGILRITQILFCIVILGISVTLIKGQEWPSAVPSQTSFEAFCGGWGIVIAFIGIVALFVGFLQGIIVVALDSLTALFMLAGGITYWASLGVHSCSDDDYTQTNVIIRASGDFDGIPIHNPDVNLKTRCQEAQATTAFLFFAFFAFVATAFLNFRYREGTTGSGKTRVELVGMA